MSDEGDLARAERDRGARPRVAYVVHPRSFSTFDLAESARPICDVVWVLDSVSQRDTAMARLLGRLGKVLAVHDLGPEEAAARIALEHPDGILTLADARLAWTAQVAEYLGLPFISPSAALNLTDKYEQRRALAAGGLATPASIALPAPDDADAWAAVRSAARFPAVLKPRSGEGSRDTCYIASLAELEATLADLSLAGSSSPGMVLEEYLVDRGDVDPDGFAGYVSVESLVSHGTVSHLAVTGRFPLAPPLRETGFFIPSTLDGTDLAEVLEVASAAVRAVGVSVGCLHTEIKLTPDGPRVIEVNGRIGGGVDQMLAAVSGVQLLEVAFRLALGEHIEFPRPVDCTNVAYLLYVQAPVGMHVVRSIDGLDELSEDPQVREVRMNRAPGEPVDWREGNHGHVYSVFGVVEDHEALKSLAKRVREDVHINGD